MVLLCIIYIWSVLFLYWLQFTDSMPGAGNCSRRGWELGNTMNIYEILEGWQRTLMNFFLSNWCSHALYYQTCIPPCSPHLRRADRDVMKKRFFGLCWGSGKWAGTIKPLYSRYLMDLLKFSLGPQYLDAIGKPLWIKKMCPFGLFHCKPSDENFDRLEAAVTVQLGISASATRFSPILEGVHVHYFFTFGSCAQASEFALHWCCLQSILCWAWKGLAAAFCGNCRMQLLWCPRRKLVLIVLRPSFN